MGGGGAAAAEGEESPEYLMRPPHARTRPHGGFAAALAMLRAREDDKSFRFLHQPSGASKDAQQLCERVHQAETFARIYIQTSCVHLIRAPAIPVMIPLSHCIGSIVLFNPCNIYLTNHMAATQRIQWW